MLDDLCTDCVRQALARKSFEVRHPADTALFKNRIGSTSTNGYLISAAWLKDWQLAKPKFFDSTTGVYPSPSSPAFAANVVCEHGGLQPSGEESRKIGQSGVAVLQKLFPDYEPIESSLETCGICTPDGPVADEASKRAHAQQKVRRRYMISLIDQGPLRDLKNHTAGSVDKVTAGTPYNLVPRAWFRQLQDFLKKDTKPMPGPIDLAPLHCHHGGVKFDIRVHADALGFAAVSEAHWAAIKSFYEVDGDSIHFDVDDHFARHTDPAVCMPCREEACVRAAWGRD